MSSRKRKQREQDEKEKSPKKQKTEDTKILAEKKIRGKPKMLKNLTKKLLSEFQEAKKFASTTHPNDIKWIESRKSLVQSFDDFFMEYVYVIIASGFRAKIAAQLTPKLISCDGDYDKMLSIFKNKLKCKAITDVWELRSDWTKIRSELIDVDSLMRFPRIGNTVKFHLARNIGLKSCVKPDLHLNQYAISHGYSDSQKMVTDIANNDNLAPGTADFMLWIWLSHHRGKESECCNGGFRLR